MFVCLVANFLSLVAASSAVLYIVENIKRMKLSWFEIFAVFNRANLGVVSTGEKKDRLK